MTTPLTNPMTAKDIIRRHHAKIGAKGGRAGKGSEAVRLKARLAAFRRWGDPEKIAMAQAAVDAFRSGTE